MRESKHQKGFTLIELMIVVAIIGILCAVAIPSFAKYRLKSKTSEGSINLAAIATSEIAYQAEFDAFIDCAANPGTIPTGTRIAWVTSNGDFDVIGFKPKDVTVYFQYKVTGSTASSFLGAASTDMDNDGASRVLNVTEDTPVAVTPATAGNV